MGGGGVGDGERERRGIGEQWGKSLNSLESIS